MFAIFSCDRKLSRKTFLTCTRCLFSESCFLQISYNCKHCCGKTFFVRITSVFFSSSRVGWSGIRFSNWRLKFRRCVWISNSDGKFPVQQTFGENLNESLYVRGLTIALIYRLKLKHSVRTSVLSRLLQYQVVRLFVVSLESYVGSNWQCEAKVWSIMYNTAVCAGIYGLSVSMGNQFSTDYSTTIRPI